MALETLTISKSYPFVVFVGDLAFSGFSTYELNLKGELSSCAWGSKFYIFIKISSLLGPVFTGA